MKRTIVIVGGVAGGASAAARLRRLNEQDNIIMLEKGQYISFANCGLPYYLGDEIKDRDALLLQTPESMKARFNIDIRTLHEAVDLDAKQKKLTVVDHAKGETFQLDYDILILSPGAKAFLPPVDGLDSSLNNAFTLRSMTDTDKIKQFLVEKQPKAITIIGAGFIGLEMAENMAKEGVKVTVVEASNQILAPLDVEMAAIVEQHVISQGITLIKNDGLVKVSENGTKLHLKSGKELINDMIIVSIGVTPDTEWLTKQPLEFGLRNSIVVNDKLQTNLPDVYAVGDAIQVVDFINKKPTYIPLAWPANRQGRIVADIINGRDVCYKGSMGTAVAKVFDLTAASTGNNEKTLQRLGLPYQVVHTHSNSHAGYYPGASMISLKLIFAPDGTILGAQAIGEAGVDKRLDVIATAVKSGLSIHDLADLELCYAPPYSSAKDPVNMIGYVASNVFYGDVDTIQWHQVSDFQAKDGILIDVRDLEELQEDGLINGSVHIPLPQLRARLDEIPKDKKIMVICKVGLRGYIGARVLKQHGYDVVNLDGGYTTYRFAKNT